MDAIVYELHVRSFQDSNGDGIGDFPGLMRRLPYLQDLGVTALWLLPFYPSPLRDDGYDIADYTGVHPDYGTLDDFRRFLDEAHRLGLRVITELVVNHTSDQHAWFQRARSAPAGSTERAFYVWSESADKYGDARIIFSDFERSNWSWDPVARAYYWHRFYSHQPDLNYDNPAVYDAIVAVLDHWFALGIDGMRLDAVPYLVEREGTHSENLGATHDIVKRLRAHVDEKYSNRIFIAEANQWPEDAAAYFGRGDESHMVFHFPLMPRLFMALRQEDRLPIVDILAQTPAPPDGCQWALFLRNHDELTLEMVTEEERLYMYHVYATEEHARINLGIRRRLAPLLGNHRRRIELMNALLFSLQGTPVLYYGDEIGMGDNIYLGDRNGVRTPMQWAGDRNAGFSTADPQRLFLPLIIDDEYHYQSVHVAQQSRNPHSLLWWMKRLIALRKRYQAFGRGRLVMVECANTRLLAFIRRWRTHQVLVVANLSRFVQHAELDLSEFAGHVPVEAFGRVALPAIGPDPYSLTLGPHEFLWLELTSRQSRMRSSAVPQLEVGGSWEALLEGPRRTDLESALPAYLERGTAWSRGGRTVLSVRIEDALPAGEARNRRWLSIIRVTYASGEPERYLLPLGLRSASRTGGRHPKRDVIADVRAGTRGDQRYEIFDAAEDPRLADALVEHVASSGTLSGIAGTLRVIVPDGANADTVRAAARRLRRLRRGSNALVAIGGRVVLKLFRQLEPGPHPEIEMRARLRQLGFEHVPSVLAGLEWHPDRGGRADRAWIGILQEFVQNDGEAWSHAVAAAADFLRQTRRRGGAPPAIDSLVPGSLWGAPADAAFDDEIGEYLRDVERIGARTAEMHRTLAQHSTDPAFAPEPMTPFSRRSEYQRMRRSVVWVVDALRTRGPALEPEVRELAGPLTGARDDILTVFHRILGRAVTAPRIRDHGNFHLGQILYAGDELVVIDFDGEPGRPLYERRLKRSPLHDVATMVRSFHYAAHAAWEQTAWRDRRDTATAWMRVWQLRVADAFLAAYGRSLDDAALLPSAREDVRVLLHAYVLERAVYEAGFELNRGSRWLRAPLADIPLLVPLTA